MSVTEQGTGVRVVEVGPRDGLQNVKKSIPTDIKIQLIGKLQDAGLRSVEITSLVNPRAIPQLSDSSRVLTDGRVQKLFEDPNFRAPVLIPNLKGLELAIKHNVKETAVFVSASEGFSKANIKCGVQESLGRAREVANMALSNGLVVRGYVSCIFACPFDGPTPHHAVLDCVQQLLAMGCYEVSLGDTVGVGVPIDVRKLLQHLLASGTPVERLAGHFHDTYGQAIANVWEAYSCGLRVFDSSVAGLGGCPYAPGAKGNLATEDLLYSLHSSGLETGVDLAKVVETGVWISRQLDALNSSRAGSAIASKALASLQVQEPMLPNLQWTRQQSGEGIIIYKSGNNLKVVLNRPKNGNALTAAMVSQLTGLFESAASDRAISRIVLTARGKFFCTGMDLGKSTSLVAKGPKSTDIQYSRLKRLFEAIDNAPQVTIACLQGPAFGGGVGLAFACDIRLVAASGTMRLTEVRLGLAPATISKYVIRELGPSLAREAMLSARVMTPRELLGLGKVTAIIDDPSTAIDNYLLGLRQCAPRASALTKELVRISWLEGGGGKTQEVGIRKVFDDMMNENCEAKYGLDQFQKGIKSWDWDAYTLSDAKNKAKL